MCRHAAGGGGAYLTVRPAPAYTGQMRCDHFDAGTCRSCSLLPLPYASQLADKVNAVVATLSPVPGADLLHWLAPASSPERGFRTSAKLVVGGTRRRPTLGILGPDRRGVDLPGCPIQHPAINRATPGLKRFIRSLSLTPYDVPAKRGELKNILMTVGEGESLMIRFVLRTRDRVSDIRAALPLLRELVPAALVVTANIHPTHEAIVEGPDEIILTRARTLPLSIEGLELGPRSFAQTNARVAAALYGQAAEWASLPMNDGRAPESLWDLYCGVGGFALACARAGFPAVTGVEVSSGAISSAISAARHAGLSRGAARFIAEDATAWARSQDASQVPDVIVVNPPRRGIGADLASFLDGCGTPRVIYSSCNPATLAADLTLMPSLRPHEGRVFDMFPHTTHAEVALLLERQGA